MICFDQKNALEVTLYRFGPSLNGPSGLCLYPFGSQAPCKVEVQPPQAKRPSIRERPPGEARYTRQQLALRTQTWEGGYLEHSSPS